MRLKLARPAGATPMRDGNLFYVIGVAPQQEYGTYQNTFQNIVRSLRLNNR